MTLGKILQDLKWGKNKAYNGKNTRQEKESLNGSSNINRIKNRIALIERKANVTLLTK